MPKLKLLQRLLVLTIAIDLAVSTIIPCNDTLYRRWVKYFDQNPGKGFLNKVIVIIFELCFDFSIQG